MIDGQPIQAPQYGVWCPLPPRTDNPAAMLPVPAPAYVRAFTEALRAAATGQAAAA